MPSSTTRLGLLKKDPVTDGNHTFNIKTMMNDNWDKIDEMVAILGPDGKVPADQLNIDTSKLATKQELTTHEADTGHVYYADDTGTANEKVVALNPVPTVYKKGLGISFTNLTANTGEVTINVNGLGKKPILKSNGSPLASGSLKANSVYTVRYNGTSFILQGEGGEYGTATAGDVIAGKTIGTEEGMKIGTMPNYSGISPGTNGIPTNGGIYADRFEYDVLLPKSGYYDTASKVHQILTNLISSNLRAGVVIPEIGITGTLTAEQLGAFMAATGTVVANTSNNYTDGSGNNVQLGTVVVNVLNFKPTLVVLYNISDAIYTTIYHPLLAYGTNSTANINVSGLRGIKLMGVASVDSTGFVMPVSVQGGTYRYFALKI